MGKQFGLGKSEGINLNKTSFSKLLFCTFKKTPLDKIQMYRQLILTFKATIMKTPFVVWVMLFALTSVNIYAQGENFICGTEETTIPGSFIAHSYSIDPTTLDDYDPIVFNISYWQVNDPNGGYNGAELTEQMVLKAVADLNLSYNQFKIFFKYKGLSSFNSPPDVPTTYLDTLGRCQVLLDPNGNPVPDPEGFGNTHKCQIALLFNYAENNGYKIPDSFNVYVPYTTSGGFGGAASPANTRSILSLGAISNNISVHEIGHNLGLFHSWSSNEHVTRIETLPNGDPNPEFNAKDAGDKVVDTAANPGFSHGGTYPFIDFSDCSYFGDEEDEVNRRYDQEILPEHVINVMGDSRTPCWENYLSMGQGIRAREIIEDDPINKFAPAITTIASLYEPYRGIYPMYYPWPGPSTPPLFQPGFEYKFIECCCEYQQPAEYGDTSFSFDINNIIKYIGPYEMNYAAINHPNHAAISITQVDIASEYAQVQKCYDNYYSPPVIGGTIVKFNDNVFNNNVTITHQDSTSINNPQLIDNLQPGLYNIIENYENGANQETVIYKENN